MNEPFGEIELNKDWIRVRNSVERFNKNKGINLEPTIESEPPVRTQIRTLIEIKEADFRTVEKSQYV